MVNFCVTSIRVVVLIDDDPFQHKLLAHSGILPTRLKFKQFLYVYGRNDQPCHHCKSLIQHITQGQRSTYFCSNCQK